MHETSIIEHIIELVGEQLAQQQGPVRVTAVRLRVGPLAGVEPEALRFAFDATIPGTLLDGAQLAIEPAPLIAWCRICLAERTLDSPQRLCCPICGRPTPDVLGGRELELAWLEVVDLNETNETTHATS
jgi:hydrogenase nickel incorporation protein HypA/HybF